MGLFVQGDAAVRVDDGRTATGLRVQIENSGRACALAQMWSLRTGASQPPGDLVFLVGSREAALACDPFFVPVDAAIVGIVDEVYAPEREPRPPAPPGRPPARKGGARG